MNATTYGLDVAKRVFQMYWVDGDTGEIVNRRFGRDESDPVPEPATTGAGRAGGMRQCALVGATNRN